EVHEEAEILEHAVSDRMIDSIDALLGRPTRDPHGDPIPTEDGDFPVLAAMRLTDVEVEREVHVARVSDKKPELLRYLAEIGIVLDTALVVEEHKDFAGTVTVRVDDRTIDIGTPTAD